MAGREKDEESFLEKIVGGIITIFMIPRFTYKLYKISKEYKKEQEKLYSPRNA